MIAACQCHPGGVLSNLLSPATNALKVDPTRLHLLRLRFAHAMQVRFDRIISDLQLWLVKEDNLALNARKYRFESDPNKVKEFNKWLEQQIDERLLQAYENNEPWIMEFVEEAYGKGYARAFDQANQYGVSTRQAATAAVKKDFMMRGLGAPETAEKLQMLGMRAFESMKGMTESMKAAMNRILIDGMVKGSSRATIVKEMRLQLDISVGRAERIVRTELTHVHAEAQLDSFEKLGMADVGVLAEWLTVTGACKACLAMSRKGPYKISKARGLIPFHPNCRCAWGPALTIKK